MDVLVGEALTADAPRVIRRLCKHWSHKYETRVDETSGVIELPDARVSLRALPDRLSVTLENATGQVPRRLMGVVAEHLQRMSGDAAFAVVWREEHPRKDQDVS